MLLAITIAQEFDIAFQADPQEYISVR
ncbi:conserved hypothetical protein [Xenorhabdus nematophila F1]|uniref:Uncharacterized protein n=1 Tax=Xenorhabdus nematophila (strain ATCC 19061 / DSM 3370 / CCUG 14189 / LMG 1036 / NCIMB 9965 / AN6) TaxID=406817 RepID=D3VI33_XENNA|nr:hypothetical protein XNC1_0448 [Xenorhabdus nematophila ATCC 19061]CCW29425.1 conserved hypothetical protein [Xenorhabdus nematophila F1]CEK21437.1 hypothetical protein XNC2_0438 [Xenorhabdus nematophila AN6/1]